MSQYAFPAGAGLSRAEQIKRIKARRKEQIAWAVCYGATAIAWFTLIGLWLGNVI